MKKSQTFFFALAFQEKTLKRFKKKTLLHKEHFINGEIDGEEYYKIDGR
jgi:uncharacterized membrane protein